jgi:hypothetical protein
MENDAISTPAPGEAPPDWDSAAWLAAFEAMAPLLRHMHPRVHLFSTGVADVAHEALRRGTVLTDGGTDIAAVTRHMVANGVRNALIATDGAVGSVPEEHARTLAGRGVRVAGVVTHDGDERFLETLRGYLIRLPCKLTS